MDRTTLCALLTVGFAAVSGCYLNGTDQGAPGQGNGGNNSGGGNNAGSGDGGTTIPGDLPCDVAQAISSCLGCHGSTPSSGAPMSLASYADLTTTSAQYPGQTEAQRAVARMKGSPTQMPPPPSPAAPQTDIDTISNWISAGYPHGTCGGGSGEGGVDPYNTPLTCTSNLTGTSHESSSMNPGRACLSCHGPSGEASMVFGGTIFPTAHEPDMCVGAGSAAGISGVEVDIVDSANHTIALKSIASSGNFYDSSLPSGWKMPYTVKVLYQGRERDMTTPQTSGDCNSCHTATGTNSAPGRIMLP